MTFETKYKIGDEFWIMLNNKPEKFFVDRIVVEQYQEPGGCYSVVEKTKINYYHNHKYSVSENEFYRTKEELLKTL